MKIKLLVVFAFCMSILAIVSAVKKETNPEYVCAGIEKVGEILELNLAALGFIKGGDPMAQVFANAWAHFRASNRGENCEAPGALPVPGILMVTYRREKKITDIGKFKKLLESIIDKQMFCKETVVGIGIGYIDEDENSLTNLFSAAETMSNLVVVFTLALSTAGEDLLKIKQTVNYASNAGFLDGADPMLQNAADEWSTRYANAADPKAGQRELGLVEETHQYKEIGEVDMYGLLGNKRQELSSVPMAFGWVQGRKMIYNENKPPTIELQPYWCFTIVKRSENALAAIAVQKAISGLKHLEPAFLANELAHSRALREDAREDTSPMVEETSFARFVIFPKKEGQLDAATVVMENQGFLDEKFTRLANRIRESAVVWRKYEGSSVTRLILALINDEIAGKIELNPCKIRINTEGMFMAYDAAREAMTNPNSSVRPYSYSKETLREVFAPMMKHLENQDLSVGISVLQNKQELGKCWVSVFHCKPELPNNQTRCTSVNPVKY